SPRSMRSPREVNRTLGVPDVSAHGAPFYGRLGRCAFHAEDGPMYERFSDRARKVMQRANRHAQRLNHEYIGTEHILLGLRDAGEGHGVQVLINAGIDLQKIRRSIERVLQPGPIPVTAGQVPQTPRAKNVLEYAIAEARRLKQNAVGTEHLLLGLLQ